MSRNLTYKETYSILKEFRNLNLKELQMSLEAEHKDKKRHPSEFSNIIKGTLYKESRDFMQKYHNQLVELQKHGMIEVITLKPQFDFSQLTTYEDEDLFYIQLTSEGINFLEEYSKFFRKVEYDYKDNSFLGSLVLGLIGGFLAYITFTTYVN